jgi:hypothetical protein
MKSTTPHAITGLERVKQNKYSLDTDQHMSRISYESDKNTKTVTIIIIIG